MDSHVSPPFTPICNLNSYDYKKTCSFPLLGGGFEACPPISSFGCLSNKLFPCCVPDVPVIGFSVHQADSLGFRYKNIDCYHKNHSNYRPENLSKLPLPFLLSLPSKDASRLLSSRLTAFWTPEWVYNLFYRGCLSWLEV